MTLCALCGYQLSDGRGLCPSHDATDDSWSASNRIMCDLVHRGVVPRRLSLADRADDLPTMAEAA